MKFKNCMVQPWNYKAAVEFLTTEKEMLLMLQAQHLIQLCFIYWKQDWWKKPLKVAGTEMRKWLQERSLQYLVSLSMLTEYTADLCVILHHFKLCVGL